MMTWRFEFDKVESSQDIKDKISEKFTTLEKYLTHVKDDFHTGLIHIIKGQRWGYEVKIDMDLPGKKVIAEGKAETLLDAADKAYHNTARIVRKHFERLQEKTR